LKTVIQRVKKASVSSGGKSRLIGQGLLVLISVKKDDKKEDAKYLAKKIANLRVFDDKSGKMNFSIRDTKGEILVVSQFTLYGDCTKGRRPGFDLCASYSKGKEMYENFINNLKKLEIKTKTGFYGKYMEVKLVNDGPVTFIIES
jgi:D-tyrosyl-tRNA(Tyr) deacylase